MRKKIKMVSVITMVMSLLLQSSSMVKAVSLEKWEIQSASDSYARGVGTQLDPYVIESIAQLLKMKQDAETGKEIGKYYQLGKDIDLQGKLWTPIGIDSDGFYQAHLDGNGYKIKNLMIDEDRNNVGFIAFNNASTLENMYLENVSIKGKDNVGGLIGLAKDHMTISNSITQNHVSGQITGRNNVGGLIGFLQYEVSTSSFSPLSQSSANVQVKGEKHTGGLIGYAQYIENIQECFTMGTVQGTQSVGGLIGKSQATKILAAYTRCNVIGDQQVSGFVGISRMGTMEDSYSMSEVKSSSGEAFVNNQEPQTTFDKCYYSTDLSGVLSVDRLGIKGLKTNEMTASQLAFNHPELWNMKDSTEHYDFLPQLAKIAPLYQEESQESTQIPKRYKVVFDLNGGIQLDNTPLTQYIEYNDFAKAPQVHKNGYQVSWDQSLRITGETVIKAVFTPIEITDIQIIGSSTVYVGETSQYTVQFIPENALISELEWILTEGQEHATLSQTGLLVAHQSGNVVIEVRLKEKPEIKQSLTVKIKDINVENVKEGIESLISPLSRVQIPQVISVKKAFDQLTSKQKNEIGKDLEHRLQQLLQEVQNLMQNKDNIQIKGQIGDYREVFIKALPESYQQWSAFSQYTKDYVSEVYECYLYDHLTNTQVQPNGLVEVTLHVQNDYMKQKGVKIIMKTKDYFVEIVPTQITSQTITFETQNLSDFAIVYQQEITGAMTSDHINMMPFVGAILVAGLGILLCFRKKKGRRHL